METEKFEDQKIGEIIIRYYEDDKKYFVISTEGDLLELNIPKWNFIDKK